MLFYSNNGSSNKIIRKHRLQCMTNVFSRNYRNNIHSFFSSIDNFRSGRFPMTIQSLCTAIRSQLHFSQITAWSDLLKSMSPFDPEICGNPRIKNASAHPYEPKLDILYRIRPYSDATVACFSATPIIHNFPETQISEQHSVKISLKSLPRMKAIPPLCDPTEVSDALDNDGQSTVLQPLIVDGSHGFVGCMEKGKHRCPFDEESPTDDSTTHRDRQLMKYKKRMLRRDRKKRIDETITQPNGIDAFNRAIDAKATETKVCKQLRLSQYDQTINPNKPPLYSTMNVDETDPINVKAVPAVAGVLSAMTTTLSPSTSSTSRAAATIDAATASCLAAARQAKSTQTLAIERTSVATQTDANQMIFHNCDFCGIEMQYFCWNCDKKMFTETDESYKPLEKADQLLKSIQRTPSTKQQMALTKKIRSRKMTGDSGGGGSDCDGPTNDEFAMVLSVSPTSNSQRNSSICSTTSTCSSGSSGIATNSDTDQCDTNSTLNENQLDFSDCRLCCKRLKTVHNYDRDSINMPIAGSSISNYNNNNTNRINKNNNNINNDSNSKNTNENSNISGNNSNRYERIAANSPYDSHSINSPITTTTIIKPATPIGNDFSVIQPNRTSITNTSYDDTQAYLLAKQHGDSSGAAGYRRTMSESVVGKCHTATANCTQPGIDLIAGDAINILSDSDLKLYRRAYSEDELICNCDDNRPKQLDISDDTNSPPIYTEYASKSEANGTYGTAHHTMAGDNAVNEGMRSSIGSMHLHLDSTEISEFVRFTEFTLTVGDADFKTPKQVSVRQTKPIYIDCHSHTDDEHSQEAVALTATKSLPKINLSKLLANVSADERNPTASTTPYNTLKNVFDFENLSPPLLSPTTGEPSVINATVQKSQSAPSFQYSPTLSPRFLKSSAANKRRTRHLSDRSSERLSIGSDEPLSDEEFHQYCHDSETAYRPGISPTKATLRFFPKNYAFRKRALLGSICTFSEFILSVISLR